MNPWGVTAVITHSLSHELLCTELTKLLLTWELYDVREVYTISKTALLYWPSSLPSSYFQNSWAHCLYNLTCYTLILNKHSVFASISVECVTDNCLHITEESAPPSDVFDWRNNYKQRNSYKHRISIYSTCMVLDKHNRRTLSCHAVRQLLAILCYAVPRKASALLFWCWKFTSSRACSFSILNMHFQNQKCYFLAAVWRLAVGNSAPSGECTQSVANGSHSINGWYICQHIPFSIWHSTSIDVSHWQVAGPPQPLGRGVKEQGHKLLSDHCTTHTWNSLLSVSLKSTDGINIDWTTCECKSKYFWNQTIARIMQVSMRPN